MPEDAGKIAPHIYKVLFENERVRVLEPRMMPGAKSELHSHPAVAGIGIRTGRYRFTSPDGQGIEAEISTGQVFYDAVDHTTENVGNTEGGLSCGRVEIASMPHNCYVH